MVVKEKSRVGDDQVSSSSDRLPYLGLKSYEKSPFTVFLAYLKDTGYFHYCIKRKGKYKQSAWN
jgi:hypothetical protein